MLAGNDNGVDLLRFHRAIRLLNILDGDLVFPSGRSHHNSPLLRTSVSFLPSFVATECVRGMQSAVSSVAYPNIMPWSPAPTSKSSFPTWTPPAISGLCLLMRTSTSQVLSLKPLLSTLERSST